METADNNPSGTTGDIDHLQSLADNAVDDQSRLAALLELAESVARTDLQRAIGTAERAGEIAARLDDPGSRGSAAALLARLRLVAGDYHDALARYREAAVHYERGGMEVEAMECRARAGNARSHLGDYEGARVDFSAGLEEARRLDSQQHILEMLTALGATYFRLNDFSTALDHLEEARSLARRLGDRLSEARSIRSMGSVKEHRGNVAEALDHYLECLEVFLELEVEDALPGLYNDLASAWCSVGEYASAIDAYREAQERFEKLGNRKGIAFVLNNLAHLHLDLGQPNEALPCLLESLAIKQDLGNDYVLVTTLRNLAETSIRLDDLPEALRYLDEAALLCDRLDDLRISAMIRVSRGVYLRARGMLEHAVDCFEQGRTDYLAAGYESSAVETAVDLAATLGQLGRGGDGIAVLEESLGIAEGLDQPGLEASVHQQLSLLLKEQGELEQALHHLEEYQRRKSDEQDATERERLRSLMLAHDRDRARRARESAEQQAELLRLEKERLQQEAEHHQRELMTTSMFLTQKNDFLRKIAKALEGVAVESDEAESILQGVLADISATVDARQSWSLFEEQFRKVEGDFIERLAARQPDLTPTELRVCALVRSGLSIKETAEILNAEPRSVETYRGRIRKKLGLSRGENLASYLAGLR